MQRHTNQWNINMIFMDYMCYYVGKIVLSGRQVMNHHANPGEWHMQKIHRRDSHSHTTSYVGTRRPEKTKKCVLEHICVFQKQGVQH